ncbi:MAG: cell wall-binding repeat-containing protein [Actinobacteria bacterium]|nr:cell wall-binding repeat-containing protein [Actinomycetota bacterium]
MRLTSFVMTSATVVATAIVPANVPAFAQTTPVLQARVEFDSISGFDWSPNGSVDITVDDGSVVDETGVPTDSTGRFDHYIGDLLDLDTGHVVTVTQGATTKTHEVTGLTITGVDPVADTVSGIATPGADVTVSPYADPGAWRHEVADGVTGEWTAHFSVAGGEPGEETRFDIIPGSSGSADEPDDDGDATQLDWHVPDPRFNAHPGPDFVDGWDWTPNSTVNVTVESDGVVVHEQLDVPTGAQGNWGIGLGEFGVDLVPGMEVTVTDGGTIKTHVITALTVTAVDPDAETVSGTAAAGAEVQVGVHMPEGPGTFRRVVAEVDGTWTADFSVPGGDETDAGDDLTVDLVAGSEGAASEFDDDGDSTLVGWRVPDPRFFANAHADRISGQEWTPDSTVAVTVDDDLDPGNGTRFEDLAVPTDEFGNFHVDTAPADVQAGDLVTVTDGDLSKTHIVTGLVVTDVNVAADTVSGFAPAGAVVEVHVFDFSGAFRRTQAASNGAWSVDFSIPGEDDFGQQTTDLGPGSGGVAREPDADRDATEADWRVPDPVVNAHPDWEAIDGWDWEPGTLVDVTVDNDVGTVFQALDVPVEDDREFQVNDLEGLDLAPGHQITASDGLTTKIHVVTDLAVTDVDPDLDTVSGTATAGAQIEVGSDQGAFRRTVADEFGDWTVDFAAPPEEANGEHGTVDLGPGSSGNAAEPDDDGDTTSIFWRVPDPVVNAHPDWEAIDGWDWEPGSFVDVTVVAGAVTAFQALDVPVEDDREFHVNDLAGLDLAPGHEITVSDGLITKTHTVTDLAVTEVDPDLDTVSGTATAGTQIDVWREQGGLRRTVADEFGDWTVDFAAPPEEDNGEHGTADLGPGSSGNAAEPDEDHDTTSISWRVPHPMIIARPQFDNLELFDFEPDGFVDITINDGGDGYTQLDLPLDESGHLWVDLEGGFDLIPGHVVTVDDGTTTKIHEVTALSVTAMDVGTDTLSGTATPFADVKVFAYGFFDGAFRHEVADAAGNWTADFKNPGDEEGEETTADLVAGSDGEVNEPDEDGDETHVAWNVPDPRFDVRAVNDNIRGVEWLPAATVDITIDSDADAENGTLHVATDVPTDDRGEFWFDVAFDVAVGHVVTVTQGETVKQHTVTGLAVTDVDATTETVSGTAEPSALVEVSVFDSSEAVRRVVTDVAGEWTADFSVPGTEEDEQATADLVTGTSPALMGTSGQAREPDVGRDATAVDWHVLTPTISARPLTDELWGDDWTPNDVVSLTVDAGVPIDDIPTDTSGHWDLPGLDLEPGQVIDVTDGVTAKTLTVTELAVTAADPAADTIAGVATPGAVLIVHLHNPFGLTYVEVTADGSGAWTADFGGLEDPHDLVEGSSGVVEEPDEEADATQAGWEIRTDATTDPDGGGATPEHPVTTAITSPNPGQITITEEPVGADPDGFVLAGVRVSITAPAATTPEDPLVIVFRLDASQIPEHEDETTITVFKDGVEAGDCDNDTGTASPDPCIGDRTALPDGDIQLTVWTVTASDWDLAFPLTAPDPPTDVTAEAGDEQATVSWSAPADTGGAPITSYTVAASPGGATATVDGATTEAVITGLTNGTAYTFTVVASNSQGDSAPSPPSTAVTPLGVPDPPTDVTAEAGDEQATVSWSAPADTGGAPILTYRVTASPGGKTRIVSGATTSTLLTGLANGTAYTFTVVATNSVGDSAASAASPAVTPLGVPDPPTDVDATAGIEEATVSWDSPADDGGAPITSYRIITSPADVGSVTVTADETSLAPPPTRVTVEGLTSGTAYTFTVIATNSQGDSAASVASNSVTPIAAPFDAKLLGGTAAISDGATSLVSAATGVGPQRIAGPDRYQTAAATVADAFPGTVDTVYIATGLNFPDALAGSAAAAALDAPVLLVTTDTVPDATAAQLARLQPRTVKLLGGTAAISDAVASRIAAITGVVPQRIAGPDRYQTAAATVADAFPGTVDTVYIATGLNFPDALAGSAAAAALGAPVLLVTTDTVPDATAAQLARLQPRTVKLLGGTAAISDAVASRIAAITGVVPQRIAGPDRYQTAAATVADAFPGTVDTVYIATGLNFPDALAGSAAAAALGAPVLLVTTDTVPDAIRNELARLSRR